MGRAVQEISLPDGTLLARYAADPACYTDCFVRDVPKQVELGQFVSVFYKTLLFRAERLILGALAGRPSTDWQADEVAQGLRQDFAAWSVEDRRADQVLMCDMGEQTRSWFMVVPQDGGTRLCFGSAVVSKDAPLVRLLMPFHRVYARVLLKSVTLS